jgi:hypothetical protein
VVKALVVALLTLPVVAYVTGSLAGARSELPTHREPVLIGERTQVEPQQTIRPEPTRRPDPEVSTDADDRGGSDDRGSDDPADDDTVSVVRPQPRDIDDEAPERDDGPDDDSGQGRSGDDGD